MSKTTDSAPTIMVVDDDDDVRMLVVKLLQQDGYNVIAAESGFDAERFALEQVPQLILMDIGMPQLDGLSTVWKLREHEQLADVPVVIFSAYDSYDLRAEAASTGCKGYLTKPVEPQKLRELVKQVLHDHEQPSLPEDSPPK